MDEAMQDVLQTWCVISNDVKEAALKAEKIIWSPNCNGEHALQAPHPHFQASYQECKATKALRQLKTIDDSYISAQKSIETLEGTKEFMIGLIISSHAIAYNKQSKLWHGRTLPKYVFGMQKRDNYRLYRFLQHWEYLSNKHGDQKANNLMLEYMPRAIRDFMEPLFQTKISTKQASIILLSFFRRNVLCDGDIRAADIRNALEETKKCWLDRRDLSEPLPGEYFEKFLFDLWSRIALDMKILTLTGVPNYKKALEYAFVSLHRIVGIGYFASTWMLDVSDIDQQYELMRLMLIYGIPTIPKDHHFEKAPEVTIRSLFNYYYPLEVFQTSTCKKDSAVTVWAKHIALEMAQADNVALKMIMREVTEDKKFDVVLDKLENL